MSILLQLILCLVGVAGLMLGSLYLFRGIQRHYRKQAEIEKKAKEVPEYLDDPDYITAVEELNTLYKDGQLDLKAWKESLNPKDTTSRLQETWAKISLEVDKQGDLRIPDLSCKTAPGFAAFSNYAQSCGFELLRWEHRDIQGELGLFFLIRKLQKPSRDYTFNLRIKTLKAIRYRSLEVMPTYVYNAYKQAIDKLAKLS